MLQKIKDLLNEISSLTVKDTGELESFRLKYLSKKGLFLIFSKISGMFLQQKRKRLDRSLIILNRLLRINIIRLNPGWKMKMTNRLILILPDLLSPFHWVRVILFQLSEMKLSIFSPGSVLQFPKVLKLKMMIMFLPN